MFTNTLGLFSHSSTLSDLYALAQVRLFAEDPRERIPWVKKCYDGYQEFLDACPSELICI